MPLIAPAAEPSSGSKAEQLAELPPATETGALGIYQLKRLWSRAMAVRQGRPPPAPMRERHLDYLIIHASGLGLEQATTYLLREAPSFEDFERWIVMTTGGVEPERVARINAAVVGRNPPAETGRWLAAIEASEPVLSVSDLAFWEEHGYVVLHDAVPAATREAAAQALWKHLGAREDNPETWYATKNNHGIMVQYFQHPAFEAIRRAPRIHKAFAQLWGTADLWATTDRVGFNPPEREDFKFPGPHLHWDVSVKTPIPFTTAGILYLTDTPPEQGAFTLVPSFQRWGEDWLKTLPLNADPRRQDLYALGARAIGDHAGDLIIWHQALPHGASPNHGTRPRMVQYVNMFPADFEEQEEWI
ncbi:MAG TPA: phytanoyl-CoA dioxygenase family protein [Xanthobacteraceae bacterium]|nr:phytanoyl-CoA dioxygenase family protein [Xanthobacteraceae bacterium]